MVLRGDAGSTSWSAFYLRDGLVRAALAVNRFKDIAPARQLIGRQVRVTPQQLADEQVDLRALARQAV